MDPALSQIERKTEIIENKPPISDTTHQTKDSQEAIPKKKTHRGEKQRRQHQLLEKKLARADEMRKLNSGLGTMSGKKNWDNKILDGVDIERVEINNKIVEQTSHKISEHTERIKKFEKTINDKLNSHVSPAPSVSMNNYIESKKQPSADTHSNKRRK